jgi:hypothetical protein
LISVDGLGGTNISGIVTIGDAGGSSYDFQIRKSTSVIARIRSTDSSQSSIYEVQNNLTTGVFLTARGSTAPVLGFIQPNEAALYANIPINIATAGSPISLGVGSTRSIYITSTNQVVIGSTTAGARLDVRAQGALSTDIAFRVRNSADTADLMSINGLGVSTINAVNQNVQLRLTNTGTTNNRSAIAFQFNNSGVDQAMIRALPGIIVGSYGRFAISTYNIFGGGMVDRMLFDEFGGVSIGASYAQNVAIPARLDVRAQGSLSTDIAFRVRNSTNTANLFSVAGNGAVNIAVAAQIDTLTVLNTTRIGSVSAIAPSAQLDVQSTTKGFLPPRMTNEQRLAIASPAVGLIVYCTDAVEGLYVNKSTGWTLIG